MVSSVCERTGSTEEPPESDARVSVLFPTPAARVRAAEAAAAEPDCFGDLNLDQVVAEALIGRGEYHLTGAYRALLRDPDEISYRQGVFADLDDAALRAAVRSFADRMRTVRRNLLRVERLRHPRQRQAWYLSAVEEYIAAVPALEGELGGAGVSSRALVSFRAFLGEYLASESFTSLRAEAERVRARLAAIRYCLDIHDGRVRVTRHTGQADYNREVQALFARFQEGERRGRSPNVRESLELNRVEATVLDLVARVFPEEFAALETFCRSRDAFVDPTVAGFDREVQFYLGYLEAIEPLRRVGLSFCPPQLSTDKRLDVEATFDLALALRLVGEGRPVVCNEIRLSGAERLMVVTGPNQGGKTTFARTVGQLHHLAALGCPVPGRRAHLALCDRVLTHFEREEDIRDLRSRLEDDLVRVRAVLDAATADSVVVMNEVFTSTTLDDARWLGRRVLERFLAKDLLGVYVTFVDELAMMHPAVVSLVATVDAAEGGTRTYRVLRRPADGRAYAAAIADRYGLARGAVMRRVIGGPPLPRSGPEPERRLP